MCVFLGLEFPLGMCQKEEKMEGFPWQVKPSNYQLPPSTFPNYSKASPKEVFLWRIYVWKYACVWEGSRSWILSLFIFWNQYKEMSVLHRIREKMEVLQWTLQRPYWTMFTTNCNSKEIIFSNLQEGERDGGG